MDSGYASNHVMSIRSIGKNEEKFTAKKSRGRPAVPILALPTILTRPPHPMPPAGDSRCAESRSDLVDGEGEHFADGVRSAEQHQQAVDAESDAGAGGEAVFEGGEQFFVDFGDGTA